MPESTRLERFRLALSYLERIEGELAHWSKLRDQQQLARTKYDEVRARYDQHVGRAKRAVDEMRADAKRDLPAAEAILDAAKSDQRKLIKLAAKGGSDAQKLNEKGRAIAVRITECTNQLEEIRTIVEAQSTGALGGGVDLPLDEYPRRLDLIPAPPRLAAARLTPLQSNLLWGVVMLVLVLGVIGTIYFWRAAPHAAFVISDAELSSGYIEVRCANEGNRPLFLYVPWPNGRAAPLPGVSGRGNSWGLMLLVRVDGESDFRLYEDAEELWKVRGSFVGNAEPILVRGGSRTRLFLDLENLEARGLNVDAVVIECAKAGGRIQARRQIDLPEY